MKLILFFCLMLCFPLSIDADVLIEPEDSFYKFHSEECSSHKKYYTSIEDAPLYTSPDSFSSFDTASKGNTFYISWIYTEQDGSTWGLYDGVDISYWIEMKHLEPLYSHQEFVLEHESQILESEIQFVSDQQGWIILYEYPNSTWIRDVIKGEWVYQSDITIHTTYKDDKGDTWGYIPYWMQHRGWINLSHPYTESEPVRTTIDLYIPEKLPVQMEWIAFPVLAVCLCTAVVLILRNQRRNSNT